MRSTRQVYVEAMFTGEKAFFPDLYKHTKLLVKSLVVPHFWAFVVITAITSFYYKTYSGPEERYPNEGFSYSKTYESCTYRPPKKISETSGFGVCANDVEIKLHNGALHKMFNHDGTPVVCQQQKGNVTGRLVDYCFLNEELL